jgi:hypothetical protein
LCSCCAAGALRVRQMGGQQRQVFKITAGGDNGKEHTA